MVLGIWSLGFGGEAVARSQGWIDMWNNAAFYTTNTERSNFNGFLVRSEGRFGLQMVSLGEDAGISPYVVYLLTWSQDDNYWNNYAAGGGGIRIDPFGNYKGEQWYNEWVKDVRLYVEVLGASFLKDQASAEAAGTKTHDLRYGLELYHEWNQDNPDFKRPWSEVWANLSFRDTNFYFEDFNSYILSYQQLFGIYFGGVKPYIRLDFTTSGKDYSWLNSLVFGPGLRFEPFRFSEDRNPWINKFKMFVEYLTVSWLKQSDGRPSQDLRFGVDLRIYIN
ncbi:MAG: hypothetical protein ABIJ26_04230 [Candidatus Margulisiibacteriota bacterium]